MIRCLRFLLDKGIYLCGKAAEVYDIGWSYQTIIKSQRTEVLCDIRNLQVKILLFVLP